MAVAFLPVLSHFQANNPWTSSDGRLCYRIDPSLPKGEEPTLTVRVWEGPWSYEYSQVEDTGVFPLSPEGLEALSAWVSRWGETVNARPVRTLEENVARRREPAPQEESSG